jgi:hypothetical protein
VSIIELLLSLAAILGAAVLFTNAVEMLGERLNLGHGSVGVSWPRWEPRCRRP